MQRSSPQPVLSIESKVSEVSNIGQEIKTFTFPRAITFLNSFFGGLILLCGKMGVAVYTGKLLITRAID